MSFVSSKPDSFDEVGKFSFFFFEKKKMGGFRGSRGEFEDCYGMVWYGMVWLSGRG